MSRSLALMLLVVNIGLLVWYRTQPESQAINPNVNYETVPRLQLLDELSPRSFARMQRDDKPRLAMNCWMIGPFPLRGEYERLRLQFGRMGVRMRPQPLRMATDTGYWLLFGPYDKLSEARQRRHELNRISGLAGELVKMPDGQTGVSYGLFAARENAESFSETVSWGQGVLPEIVPTSGEKLQLWGRFNVRGVSDLEAAVLATVTSSQARDLRKKSCNTIASGFQFD